MIHCGCRTSRLVRNVGGICLSVLLAACSKSLNGNQAAELQQRAAATESAPPILLFVGTGTSQNDVAAIETILNQNTLRYTRINSERLDAMNQSQMHSYRLLIVPGGNFVDMGNNLTAGTAANVRNAVNGGMSYLGICAGGFLAGSFPAPYKGFDLTSGVRFGFYSAEQSGIRKAAVRITTAEGPALDQYWEDGPELSGWGEAVARYPDGKPAIAEGFAGNGWVILTGIHPEAPETWGRELTFSTPVSASNAYAMTLIDAALNRRRLPHY
jgi:glutamine amidotransferase-like uncharacterized protein